MALGRLRLGELLLLDVEAKIAHEICAHLEDGGFGRVKAKIRKDIAAGFGRLLLHDREKLSGSDSVCSATRNVWREVHAQHHVKLRAALSPVRLNESLNRGTCHGLLQHATSARALLPP